MNLIFRYFGQKVSLFKPKFFQTSENQNRWFFIPIPFTLLSFKRYLHMAEQIDTWISVSKRSSSIWFQHWKSRKVSIFFLGNYLTWMKISHNSESINSFTHFATYLSHISSWNTNNSTNFTISISNFLKITWAI